ncbi:hypothetical protein EES44_24270 [Streptomyces sp. ADI96-15]|uniref:hypothetical protein n=1 Tax=Streptomyces sp. ADI96-15 TaxID=1522761 RepID=UPI000F551FB0|nr:hypothetical protein [Streptomyces sp. ADI96-15]RPK58364.1 hypothetical protein EES44_24270 [Streptomyces sp. ADI96-15]
MALTPLALHDLTEVVLACVCAALQDTADQVDGQPGCPCRACVVPGAVAWDSCDDPCGGKGDGGQLSVNVVRMFPTNPFPTEDRSVQGARNCQPPTTTAVELAVTLLRCAPTVTELGCPPSCEELGDAARILHVDAVTVFNALYCCLPGTGGGRRGRKFVMGQQRTIGPEGGCVGVEQRVIVAMPGCAPCPGEESA